MIKKTRLGETKYKCGECGLKFRNKIAFKEHKKEHELYRRTRKNE